MSENKIYKILYFGILLVLSAITVYILYLIFFNLNKGFELSDESYYGLATQYPLDTKTFASCFGIVSNKLCFGNSGLYSLRLFRFIYQILALLSFCVSLFFYIRQKFPAKTKVTIIGLIMVFITGFTNYDYLPQTLSYNSWSFILSLFFWSSFLIMNVTQNKKLHLIISLLIGFLLTLLFYCKLPNAIVLFAFFAGYSFLFYRKQLPGYVATIAVGSIFALFFLFGNVSQIESNTTGMFRDILNVNHASIGGYLRQFPDYLFNTLDYRLAVLEMLGILSLFFIKNKIKFPVGFSLIIGNLIAAAYCFKGNSVRIENDFTVALLFLINMFVLLLLFSERGRKSFTRKEVSLMLVLLFMPILLALGTNNSLFYTGSQVMAFGIAAGVLFLLNCNDKVAFAGIILMSVIAGFFLISVLNQGMITSPYRQTSLSEKNMPLFFSETANTIYESRDRFDLFCGLNLKIKMNNPDHYPICAGFSYVGGAYLSGNKTLPAFWLPDPGYGYEKVREFFKTVHFKKENMFILLSSKDAANKGYIEILRKNAIDIGNKLRLCDSLYVNYNKEYIYFYKTM